jgi:uncharacterized membrane protein required for colicin V production
VFAIRGARRGTARQLFGLLGVLGGLWSAAVVSQWVGQHWQGARPAVVFWVLRWLVAALAGLAVAALVQFLGDRKPGAGQADSPGWLDRTGGFVIGAALGAFVVAAAILLMLVTPWPREAARVAVRARATAVVLPAMQRVAGWSVRLGPGSESLRRIVSDAEQRSRLALRHS